MPNGLPGPGLGSNLTPLTRNVLVTLFVVYVAQLASGGESGPVWELFAWQPFGSGFSAWQVFTAFLLGGPTPLSAVLDWLVLFFLLAPVDGLLGRRGLVQALGVAWAAAVLASAGLLAAGILAPSVFVGIGPLLGALVALFGFRLPHAQFLLFFVVPVRAIWLAWGSGLLAFLNLLYARDLSSSLLFFAWAGASAWLAVRDGALRRTQLEWKRRQVEKKLSRFEVIDGGRTDRRPRRTSDPNDWIH